MSSPTAAATAGTRTALVGGHIMVAAINIGEAMAGQASGAPIRNLGQMSSKRSEVAPDVLGLDCPRRAEAGGVAHLQARRRVSSVGGPVQEGRQVAADGFGSLGDPVVQVGLEGEAAQPQRRLVWASVAHHLDRAVTELA